MPKEITAERQEKLNQLFIKVSRDLESEKLLVSEVLALCANLTASVLGRLPSTEEQEAARAWVNSALTNLTDWYKAEILKSGRKIYHA